MIDIHSHIIFDVDDGPKTLEDSLALLHEARNQGVRLILATSHRRKGMFETAEQKIMENFLQVKERAAQELPELTLCYGAEIYYSRDVLAKLAVKTIPTMNASRHVLLEFSKVTPWKDIQEAVREVQLLGLTPVLAHIERYDALAYQEDRVAELIEQGCYTQVNSSHVLKAEFLRDPAKEMKKRTRFFLEKNLVHCVASDMHNLDSRPPFMAAAYRLVAEDFGNDRAAALFRKHPLAILRGEEISSY